MTGQYIISPAARSDLEAIWDYYALEIQAPDVADRINDELFLAMRKLAKSPGLGHMRTDLAPAPLRFWCVRNYLIIYRSLPARPIEIVRVLHAARDVESILNREP